MVRVSDRLLTAAVFEPLLNCGRFEQQVQPAWHSHAGASATRCTVQAEVAPFVEYLLEPLRELGVYLGVTCDVPRTVQLLGRPEVVAVHMTGGRKTHDAIVWGPTVRIHGFDLYAQSTPFMARD